jgi:hypothetical protein
VQDQGCVEEACVAAGYYGDDERCAWYVSDEFGGVGVSMCADTVHLRLHRDDTI